MRKVLTAVLVTILLVVPASQYAIGNEIQREHVIILVDLSDSALHVSNELFARKAAQYIGNTIDKLPLGSIVELRTFGEYDRSKNITSFKFLLSRKAGHRPADVKQKIGLFIGNLPKLVSDGKLTLQEKTSLIGELKILSERLDTTRKTRIIILSDMLEYSAEANCYKLIGSKNGKLSETPGILENVDIVALGAGYGCKSSNENDRLKAMWSAWFEKAGASEFRYLSDF